MKTHKRQNSKPIRCGVTSIDDVVRFECKCGQCVEIPFTAQVVRERGKKAYLAIYPGPVKIGEPQKKAVNNEH